MNKRERNLSLLPPREGQLTLKYEGEYASNGREWVEGDTCLKMMTKDIFLSIFLFLFVFYAIQALHIKEYRLWRIILKAFIE